MHSLDPFRLLVVANETVEGEVLHDAVVRIAADRPVKVVVVAPAFNGPLTHWLSAPDRARTGAEARLARCLEWLRGAGVDADGWVGDSDPLLAIADALRRVGADELLIATRPETSSNWLAHGLVERAVVDFGLPTAHLTVDVDAERGGLEQGELAAA